MKRRQHIQRKRMSLKLASTIAAIITVVYSSSVNASRSKCSLPLSWRGRWFHSGVPLEVTINEASIDFKGDCVESDSADRYIMKDRRHGCYRCLVIHQKHTNVIQYKETLCSKKSSLENLCNQLTGDSLLHSMFRLDATPVSCPFSNTYSFTYNRGRGECSYPKSTVDLCTQDWKLLFRYQACPDVPGTESAMEVVECLAVWKEGSNHFMIGKSEHPLASSNENRYRCYLYEPWVEDGKQGFLMSQSGDATCIGLFSVTVGSRTLRLIKEDSSSYSKCQFPSWVGGLHWHSLDGSTSLHVTKRNTTLRVAGHADGPATMSCLQEANGPVTSFSATYVTRVVHGCTSGYQCIHLLHRDRHVLEVMTGAITPVAEEACSNHFYNKSSDNFTTYVSGNPENRNCPGMGRYEITHGQDSSEAVGLFRGKDNGFLLPGLNQDCETTTTKLTVGCSSTDTLEIHTECSHSVFSCHGWWEESGRHYLVVTPTSRSSKGVRRLCLVLEMGPDVLFLASSPHTCGRNLKPGQGYVALNTTSSDGCGEALASSTGANQVSRASFNIFWTLIAIAVSWILKIIRS